MRHEYPGHKSKDQQFRQNSLHFGSKCSQRSPKCFPVSVNCDHGFRDYESGIKYFLCVILMFIPVFNSLKVNSVRSNGK